MKEAFPERRNNSNCLTAQSDPTNSLACPKQSRVLRSKSFVFFLTEWKDIHLKVRPAMGSLSMPWMIGKWTPRFDGKVNDSDKSVPMLISYDKSDVDYPGNQTGPPRLQGAYQLPLISVDEPKLAFRFRSSKCYNQSIFHLVLLL
jgi:hypothetical protein